MAFILALVLVLLALPIHYSAQASYIQRNFGWDWQLRWGWIIHVDRFVKKKSKDDTATSANAKFRAQSAMEQPKVKRQTESPSPQPPSAERAQRSKEADTGPLSVQAPEQAKPSVTAARKANTSVQQDSIPAAPASGNDASSSDAQGSSKDDDAIIAENSEMGSTWQDRLSSGYETARDLWSYRQWAVAWCTRFLHELHLSPLAVQGKIGVGDPYLTAQAFGCIVLLQTFHPRVLSLSIQPSFLEVATDVDVRISGWMSPLLVLVQVVLLLFDPKARTLYRKVKSLM